jgi:hypothetical protein
MQRVDEMDDGGGGEWGWGACVVGVFMREVLGLSALASIVRVTSGSISAVQSATAVRLREIAHVCCGSSVGPLPSRTEIAQPRALISASGTCNSLAPSVLNSSCCSLSNTSQ